MLSVEEGLKPAQTWGREAKRPARARELESIFEEERSDWTDMGMKRIMRP
jgi:hypothetical protein